MPIGSSSDGSLFFDREMHLSFLRFMIDELPPGYEWEEINHLTLAYFAISSLDMLDTLDELDKDHVANWVLSFRVYPRDKSDIDKGEFYGFCGSKSSQFPSDDSLSVRHNGSHLASTYCALAILKIIGHNLLSIDPESILASMRNLQQQDGSFIPIHIGAEKDLRFVFCAVAICFILDDWKGMDCDKAKEYILSCQSYDGGFGLVPGSESHGGATYCAVASLQLMGCKFSVISSSSLLSNSDVQLLIEWCLQRQAADGGFQGRTNKASDSCYAFWVGGILNILGANLLFDRNALCKFLLSCQGEYGGFSKFPGERSDLYHSYYGLSGFSLLGDHGLKVICPELGITHPAIPKS